MSAHQYITRKRLDACKDAILGDEPIGQICQQFGFSDYTSFYRRFKRNTEFPRRNTAGSIR